MSIHGEDLIAIERQCQSQIHGSAWRTLEPSPCYRDLERITRYRIGHVSRVGKSNPRSGYWKTELIVSSRGESRTSQSLRGGQARNQIHRFLGSNHSVPAVIARVSKASLMDFYRSEREVDMENAGVILSTISRLHLRRIRDTQNNCSLNIPSVEEVP